MRTRSWTSAVAIAVFTVPAPAMAAVAYIDQIYPSGRKVEAGVRVKRSGKIIALHGSQPDLEDGDEIYVLPNAKSATFLASRPHVTIRYYANNQVVSVWPPRESDGASNDHYTVRAPHVAGLTGAALAFFRSLMHQSGGGSTIAASKGFRIASGCSNDSGQTNEPIEFALPGLVAERSYLVAGKRPLVVAWQGGAAPFIVTIFRAEDRAPLARTGPVSDACVAVLPVDLSPGQYRLSVEDKNGVRVEESNIVVTDRGPSTPAAIRRAALDDEARAIYRTTWLSLTDKGSWAFEAQQELAARPCTQAIKESLRRWSTEATCGMAR